MNIPENLRYSKTHIWADFTSDTVSIGLTDFAQHSMKSIVFVTLPEEGDMVTAGESLGQVESVKTVSEIISPVTGRVSRINERALDEPESINTDPYGVWLVEMEEVTDREELMDAAAFAAYCGE
ncbi:glycine cleavage system protein GcvH [Anaerotruncus rubiinfantis]|uniref:glycine cleavage system protein GcvH n=1 Tax=Anaerotruncus rubiinfantis TaxID=1720200 RepID=UPI00083240AD|nr:glycine cleavage system protein GcvH [Anaerotruncus rubiinfantis]